MCQVAWGWTWCDEERAAMSVARSFPTSMKILMNDVHWDCWVSQPFSNLRPCTAFQFRPLALLTRKEAVPKVKKWSAILKSAMSERQERLPTEQVTLAAAYRKRGWTKLA